ncbi:protein lifeguard 2 [Diplodia corticola]|uniref:Protein lifeguard 2 n=1 Tax=Diplodia corticola TaxID=236234 RepID=A0A1J9RJ78_9PEZI|nr:protein lifeguard 2 [Diplodia corticola]OJD40513.1 protein lifeguard 2 [Diplodia corticola]
MPSPPPPYSPNPGQQSMSAAMGASPSLSSGPFATPQNTSSPRIGVLNQSPSGSTTSPLGQPSFPPPPPTSTRDRSSSRNRDKRSVFGLSALTGRSRGMGGAEQSRSAIDSLRLQTTEALARTPGPTQTHFQMPIAGPSQTPSTPQRQAQWTPEVAQRPPASRRAASTGGIGMSLRDEGSSTPSRTAAWEPGMPLPPPPPGPPPSGSRSQSMNRTSELSSRSASNSLATPAPRRAAGFGSTLGPIPPTPADWREEDARNRSKSPWGRALRLTTQDPHGQGSLNGSDDAPGPSEPQTAHPSSSASNAGLSRAPARRDPSARGIRERRSESRAAKEKITETQSAVEPSNNPWARDMEAAQRPKNLILTADSGSISQRRKNTPRSGSGFSSPSSGQPSARDNKSFGDMQADSSNSTPRQMVMSPESFAPTPPFSPGGEGYGEKISRFRPSPGSHAKTLPTPPPHSAGMPSSISTTSSGSERPLSHILHTPLDNVPMVQPLHPSRPSSSSSAAAGKTRLPTDQELFAQASIDRHREFIQRESAAVTDQERLELFADFIVHESRLRRDRYSSAFEAMASDILDLTRDMWRSYTSTSAGRRSGTPNKMDSTPVSQHERQDSISSVESFANPSPAISSATFSPRGASESPLSSASSHGTPGRTRGDSNSWQPCLSPIPSMAVSTVPDEEDSRGRSASRWWEGSANGSQGHGKKIERSKRESKYMGVQLTEAQEYMQWENDNYSGAGTPGPSETTPVGIYGPNDYPPEKVGWHEQDMGGQIPPPPPLGYWTHSAPATPDPFKLDVSRLVTLPPPYPRHHPAVNNSHPDLGSIRANLRGLLDPEDTNAIRENYQARSDALREKGTKGERSRRAELRAEIQDKIVKGEMSFGEAAQAEAEFDSTEAQITQRRIQQDFDMFQKDVMTPLHALLSERIRKATASIEQLKTGLLHEAQATSPNQTQEEGDEQPELLEKLTLFKWLFEAREQLYKELLELEAQRNNLYKTLVVTPYAAAKNKNKVREAEDFFARDAHERKVAHEKQALKRFEDFHATVEDNVTRGVEDQLSAFWDIGPGLWDIVQKIPETLTDHFQILIPPMEYEENPSYHEHPLQYLYTLLSHAQKSAYQFIESQTNLLCLLHEVKTGVMSANTKLLGTQRVLEGEDRQAVDEEMSMISRDEEQRLTEDLKDKVNLVEEQWREALGKGIEDCMDRVQVFLLEGGGWDESLQD